MARHSSKVEEQNWADTKPFMVSTWASLFVPVICSFCFPSFHLNTVSNSVTPRKNNNEDADGNPSPVWSLPNISFPSSTSRHSCVSLVPHTQRSTPMSGAATHPHRWRWCLNAENTLPFALFYFLLVYLISTDKQPALKSKDKSSSSLFLLQTLKSHSIYVDWLANRIPSSFTGLTIPWLGNE